MKKKTPVKWEHALIILYFTLYFIIGISLLFKQPFGDPPDEYNRYLIPQYIAEHGTLPNGYDEEIRIPGYGFSYGFQPILPYMAQGYVMRIAKFFTDDAGILLYCARMVDFLFGYIMAVVVLLLGKKWFANKWLQYLFSYFVMFLPQSIFVHTYVNTDSCCMLSIALMLYGLTCCLENNFSYRSCITLSIGIILCALSYYNAYGFILSCILLFAAHFLSIKNGKPHLALKPFLKKGLFISALVLLGIGWWFIRSYLLYDGDFLGLRVRDDCALLYAFDYLKPGFRITYASQGHSIWRMIFESDFVLLSLNSFICSYGPMSVTTSIWVYRFYKLFFLTALLSLLSTRLGFLYFSPYKPSDGIYRKRPALRIFYHLNMLFCIVMPCNLSLYYSYRIDYQPQGRYILPILIPFAYYCIRGLEKGYSLLGALIRKLSGKNKPISIAVWNRLLTGLSVFLMAMIVICLCVTVFGYAFPYYDGL